MEISLKHGVQYEITEAVSVDDLVSSIQAHARLLDQAGKILTDAIPGLNIQSQRVSVLNLRQESPLRELFAFSLVVAFQKELTEEVPQIITDITGLNVPDQYDTLVTVLVMLVAIYGVSKAFDAMFPEKPKDNLQKAQDSLSKKAAKMLGITVDRLMASVEVLFTGRSRRVLVGASQKVFAPTRAHSGAYISDEKGTALVGPEATRDAQAASGLPFEPEDENKPNTDSELYLDVRIILHAMDRDNKKSGWAGHCPDLFDDRIKMHLEKNLEPGALFGKNEIQGDILLIREEDEDGEMQPKEFLLIKAYLQ